MILDDIAHKPFESRLFKIIPDTCESYHQYDSIDHLGCGKNADGDYLLRLLVEGDDSDICSLWYIYIPISDKQYQDMHAGKISFRALIVNAEITYAIREDFNQKIQSSYLLTQPLHAEYLPDGDLFLNKL